MDSTLVRNLLRRGLARGHRHGGLDVEPDSGRVVDVLGRTSPNLSALGELTAGVHFFTSALEINARHAERQARAILGRLTPREPAASPPSRLVSAG